MSTQEMTVTNERREDEISSELHQYKLWQILGIWLPGGDLMWLLGWVIYPVLSAGLSAMDTGLLRIKLMTVGLVWQFMLSMIILYHEEGNLRLSTIGRRFRLNHPVSPKNGETKKSLWWWIIPLIVLVALIDIALRPVIVRLTGATLPFLTEPKGYDMSAMFTPELYTQWVGAWGLFGLFFVFSILNSASGRGTPVPRRAAAQDERRVWQMGLGGQWRTVWVLPSAPALGHSVLCPHRSGLRLLSETLPDHLVLHRVAFRAEHLHVVFDRGARARPGLKR